MYLTKREQRLLSSYLSNVDHNNSARRWARAEAFTDYFVLSVGIRGGLKWQPAAERVVDQTREIAMPMEGIAKARVGRKAYYIIITPNGVKWLS